MEYFTKYVIYVMSKQPIKLSLVEFELTSKKLLHRIIPTDKWH